VLAWPAAAADEFQFQNRSVGFYSSPAQAALARDLAMSWRQLATGCSLEDAAKPFNVSPQRHRQTALFVGG
jgi:hypothetical protein